MNETIGARGVNETAEILSVHKSRVVQMTTNVFRKLRWPNHLKKIEEFIDEYTVEPPRL